MKTERWFSLGALLLIVALGYQSASSDAFAGVSFGTVTPVKAQGIFDPICVALNAQDSSVVSVQPSKQRHDRRRVEFCGQCTKNEDCGTCRCVGPSDGSCNECVCP